MAHENFKERQSAVIKMIAADYSRLDMKNLASKFGCTYTTIYMDVVKFTQKFEGSIFCAKGTKESVMIRDNNTCQYCGTSNGKMIAEHVIPFAIGGNGSSYNIVAACNSCNSLKKSEVWIPKNIEVLRLENQEWASRIIEWASESVYTFENWIKFKEEMNLTNKQIAIIIGTSEQNIKMQASQNKPLSTWMKAFIYSWVKVKAMLIILYIM